MSKKTKTTRRYDSETFELNFEDVDWEYLKALGRYPLSGGTNEDLGMLEWLNLSKIDDIW